MSLLKTVGRGTIFAMGASLVTLGLGILRSSILAHYLSPLEVGVLALAMLYMGIADRLRNLGLEPALLHHAESAGAVGDTFAILTVGTSFVSAGLILFASIVLPRYYPDSPGLGIALLVVGLTHILKNVSSVQEGMIKKGLHFRRLAIANVVTSVVTTLGTSLAAWAGLGLGALLVERTLAALTRLFILWGPLRVYTFRRHWDREIARWFLRYGFSMWKTQNLNYYLDKFDDFWCSYAFGEEGLGIYAKAYEFALYPRRIFANSLITTLGPTFARLQQNRVQLSKAFFRSAYMILRINFLVAMLFALAMPEFIHYVIGEQWRPMLPVFRLMLVYTALDPLMLLTGSLIRVTGHPQALERTRFIQFLFFVPAVIGGAALWGVAGVAIAADLMMLVGFACLYHPTRAVVDLSIMTLVRWPSLAILLAVGSGLWIEQWLPDYALIGLIIKGTVALLLYILLLGVVERRTYVDGIRWLRNTLLQVHVAND